MNIIKKDIDKVYNKESIKDIMKNSIKKETARDVDDDDDEVSYKPGVRKARTFGKKAADVLTKRIGSWHYIVILSVFLLIWVIINTSLFLAGESWDPYPYILLNLILAAIAAIEVPIILMSQNRQEQHHMEREKYDISVDKKSEREIREIRTQLNRIEEKLKR